MIGIIDYGVGNLFSLTASLRYIGGEPVVTGRREDLEKADRIILPGVGAFEDAMKKLEASGLVETVMEQVERGKPMLGICLGMQLLFEESFEYGRHRGLGLIKGKVAYIGWNSLSFSADEPLFKYTDQGECVYYVHSFYGRDCRESTIATSEYGIEITGAVRNGNVYGTQFHPEKSGETGLNILRAFMEI